MSATKTYRLRAEVVVWPGQQSVWHLIHVDKKRSAEIQKKHGKIKRGFGSIPVVAKIGKTSWNTSIFFDNRSGTYILPLNVKVRAAEGISEGDLVSFTLAIRA